MPRRGLATLMLLAVVPRAAQADTETRRKNDALVAEGYNLTQSWSFGATPAARTERIELVVPEAGEHTVRFWATADGGPLAFRLLGPDGASLASWAGRTGELTVSW